MDISASLSTEFKGKDMDNVVFYYVGAVFSSVSLLEEINSVSLYRIISVPWQESLLSISFYGCYKNDVISLI